MNAQLAIIGHRTSETITQSGSAPVDLTDVGPPSSTNDPAAARLLRAIEDALRNMRVRQRQVPGDATSPLRLGLIVTADNGTGLDVQTGSRNLRDLDLGKSADRETVLDELHTLERKFLTEDE